MTAELAKLLLARLPQETQDQTKTRLEERDWATKVLGAKVAELEASVARIGAGPESPLAFAATVLQGMRDIIRVGRQYE